MKAVLLDDVDLTSAIPTFIGSVLSMFAAGSIFACYMILPPRKHFRHTLILNLAAAGKPDPKRWRGEANLIIRFCERIQQHSVRPVFLDL